MQKMDWISVKDRLPEYSDLSIVYCKEDNYMTVGLWFYTSPKKDDIEWIDLTDRISVEECKRIKVTHWMPLPEIPRT